MILSRKLISDSVVINNITSHGPLGHGHSREGIVTRGKTCKAARIKLFQNRVN